MALAIVSSTVPAAAGACLAPDPPRALHRFAAKGGVGGVFHVASAAPRWERVPASPPGGACKIAQRKQRPPHRPQEPSLCFLLHTCSSFFHIASPRHAHPNPLFLFLPNSPDSEHRPDCACPPRQPSPSLFQSPVLFAPLSHNLKSIHPTHLLPTPSSSPVGLLPARPRSSLHSSPPAATIRDINKRARHTRITCILCDLESVNWIPSITGCRLGTSGCQLSCCLRWFHLGVLGINCC
ncbi:uncharacterized protein B0I36DRAFT_154081 [Microdochium trichocladiopsis]|uniref:Uncharacterized protein n=1 Tax=Microdochium trichocladiopsis TaxID=1682393 RepID=A0A9P8XZT8_9PEZI|nr:uncharacterized protein B0I36DRAFT_154081 [Microdochium trichocladiopsis]KAH7026133.1 hypothetical protein B0I36DRAFT_154081 [Microdochium trichocladiopsis]